MTNLLEKVLTVSFSVFAFVATSCSLATTFDKTVFHKHSTLCF